MEPLVVALTARKGVPKRRRSSVTYSPTATVGTVLVQTPRKGEVWWAMSKSKLKILYSEGDADVLASQAAAIQKAGHHVTTAEGRKAVEEQLKRDAFDLVILGPTLTRNDRHHLPYMVKKSHEGTRVLVLHADGGRHPEVDAILETGHRMETLLETIASVHSGEAVSTK